MSVCLSVRMIQLENHRTDFDENPTFQFPTIVNTNIVEARTREVGTTLGPLNKSHSGSFNVSPALLGHAT
jgi:hypothetical protein